MLLPLGDAAFEIGTGVEETAVLGAAELAICDRSYETKDDTTSATEDDPQLVCPHRSVPSSAHVIQLSADISYGATLTL